MTVYLRRSWRRCSGFWRIQAKRLRHLPPQDPEKTGFGRRTRLRADAFGYRCLEYLESMPPENLIDVPQDDVADDDEDL